MPGRVGDPVRLGGHAHRECRTAAQTRHQLGYRAVAVIRTYGRGVLNDRAALAGVVGNSDVAGTPDLRVFTILDGDGGRTRVSKAGTIGCRECDHGRPQADRTARGRALCDCRRLPAVIGRQDFIDEIRRRRLTLPVRAQCLSSRALRDLRWCRVRHRDREAAFSGSAGSVSDPVRLGGHPHRERRAAAQTRHQLGYRAVAVIRTYGRGVLNDRAALAGVVGNTDIAGTPYLRVFRILDGDGGRTRVREAGTIGCRKCDHGRPQADRGARGRALRDRRQLRTVVHGHDVTRQVRDRALTVGIGRDGPVIGTRGDLRRCRVQHRDGCRTRVGQAGPVRGRQCYHSRAQTDRSARSRDLRDSRWLGAVIRSRHFTGQVRNRRPTIGIGRHRLVTGTRGDLRRRAVDYCDSRRARVGQAGPVRGRQRYHGRAEADRRTGDRALRDRRQRRTVIHGHDFTRQVRDRSLTVGISRHRLVTGTPVDLRRCRVRHGHRGRACVN